MKEKKGVTIVNAFLNSLGSSNRKPNKIWVDQGSEFYNNSFKKLLKNNDIDYIYIYIYIFIYLFGILAIENVNVISHVMLENI